MKNKHRGWIIDSTIGVLVLAFILDSLGQTISALGTGVASLLYLICYRLARKSLSSPPLSYHLLMWIPAVALVVVPALWTFISSSELGLSSLFWALPWLKLLIPVLLLLILRHDLRHHSE